MNGLLLFAGSFVVMEAVSYAAHRWVMHGFGMGWHRSHHLPPKAALERNDLFPVCFSVVGIVLFAAAALGARPLWFIGGGVTAYGATYLFVHEVFIHRRLAVPVPELRYLRWLRDSHRDHHAGGAEPYGMLLPVVRGSARSTGRDPLDRASAREPRARL